MLSLGPAQIAGPTGTSALSDPSLISATVGPNVDVAGEASPDRQRVEPTIAVDPRNPNILVAGAQDLRLKATGEHRWHGYYRSIDGGQTWSSSLLPGFPGDMSPQGLASPLHGFNTTSDPVLAFDNNGNVYYTGIVFQTGNGVLFSFFSFVAKYGNDGADYSGATLIQGVIDADKPWIAVDTTGGACNGDVYVAYDATVGSFFSTVLSRSIDGGKTFSSPFLVTPDGTGELPGVAIDGSGNVFVSTMAFNPTTGAALNYIEISKVTGCGTLLVPPVKAANPMTPLPSPLPAGSFRTFTIPQMAADSQGVYLVWDDYRTGNADVLFSRSTDGGATWTSPLRVNDFALGQQFFPTITVANGVISIAWYDNRLDLSLGLSAVDVFFAYSTNAGVKFSANLRVTTTSFNPNTVLRTDAPNTLEHFLGDYIGIAASPLAIHPIWTDNLNACDTIDPTYGCIDQDAFTARISEKVLTSVSSTLSLDRSTVTTSGTILVDGGTMTISGNITVTASDTVSGVTTFTKTYMVVGLPLRQSLGLMALQSRFLLTAAVSPYTLSSDITVQVQSTITITVQLTRHLDINGDGTVNIFDASVAGTSYGCALGSSCYNPAADFNGNGVVNIFDFAIFGAFYGSPAFR
jgi:hypothetical protein